MVGNFQFVLEVPEWVHEAGDFQARKHNKWVRDTLKEALEEHHKKRIPDHFKQSARHRYKYAPRDPKYLKSKARYWGSRRDLVKTGDTEREMKRNKRIVISGSASGISQGKKGIAGRLILRFPFKGGTGRFKKPHTRQAVNILQMKDEIERILPSEEHEINRGIAAGYMKRVEEFISKRKRKRRTKGGGL